MASTPNLNIPLIDITAPADPVTQMNAQATAVDTQVGAALNRVEGLIGLRIGTIAQRTAALSSVPNGTLWQESDGGKWLYQKSNGAWRVFSRSAATSPSGLFTTASGWKLINFRLQVTLGVCSIYVDVERTGGAISVNAAGDITNASIGQIADGYQSDTLTALASGASGRMASGYTDSSRTVAIAAVGGSGNILTGHRISVGGTYLLAALR